MTVPMAKFNQALNEAISKHGEATAFSQGSASRRISRPPCTFTAMAAMINAAEAWLREYGCQAGDRVAALTFNRVETVALEWATYRVGAVWIGVPAREREPDRLLKILDDFCPKLLLFETAAVHRNHRDHVMNLEDYSHRIPPPDDFAGSHYRAFQRADTSPNLDMKLATDTKGKLVRIRYTSGSSGRPKAIAYSDQTSMAILDMISDKVMPGDEVTMVHCVPAVWATGSLIAPVFCQGWKNVLLPNWNLKDFVHTVADEEAAMTFLTPRLLAELARYSEDSGKGWAQSLRRVLIAGAPLPVTTVRRARSALPRSVEYFVTLGQTEASFPITWHPVAAEDFVEGGRPLVPLGKLTSYYESKPLMETKGELRIKGKSVAPGTWDTKTGSFESIDEYHATGDFVEEDKCGTLHYLGRKDNVVPAKDRLGGRWAPVEAVEALVDECPGVKRSRLDYCPDGGPVLTVQLHGLGTSEKAIAEFFTDRKQKANLTCFELAKIRFGEIPRTMSGKIRRNEDLRRAACNPPVADASPNSQGGNHTQPGEHSAKGTDWHAFDFAQLERGPLYYYVGAGLSMHAGLVGWNEMARLIGSFIKEYEKNELELPHIQDPKVNAKYLQAFIPESQGPSGSTEESKVFARAALLNIMLRYRRPRFPVGSPGKPAPCSTADRRRRPGREPSAEDLILHSLIWRSKCHGVLTTNYDMLLEHAFSLYNHGAALRSYRYNASLLRYLLSNPRFILKLHGDINDIRTMLFDPYTEWNEDEGRLKQSCGLRLKRVYNAVLSRGHMVYVGCGFGDPTISRLHNTKSCRQEDLDKDIVLWPEAPGACDRRQIALVEDCQLPPIKKQKKEFQHIQFFSYPEGRHENLQAFLKRIVGARAGVDEPWHRCPEATDVFRQVFRPADPSYPLKRRYETEAWTCKGRSIRS